MARRARREERQELDLAQAASTLLGECRMVLPGIQALFGFQLIAVFNERFARDLGRFDQLLHMTAISLIAIAVALAMEVLLTVMLVSVILGTSTQHRMVGPNATIAVGATIVACNIFGKGESGASMNPARSLGPAIVSGATESWWVYVVGPLAGAAIAVALAFVIHGRQKADEAKAAKGGG